MQFRTPLAWQNLTHDLRRLGVAVAGVTFAVILIFMELGFLNALLESTVQVLRKLNGEIVIVSTAQYALIAGERFDERRIYQAREVEGVAQAWPVYLEAVSGMLRPKDDRGYPIRVLAAHQDHPVLNFPEFDKYAEQLSVPHSTLGDVCSRREFKFPRLRSKLQDYEAELNGKELRLVGHFRLGVDFATEGNLLMTADNLARFFPYRGGGRPLSVVDLGVIKLEQGQDVDEVLQRLTDALPSDVKAIAKDRLIRREKNFWATNAPLGYIFMIGTAMGFIVGIVICYQIIYSDITDHLREFATLKAMGYRNPYFIALVIRQCCYLAVMGFLPGLAISWVAYQILTYVTGLTMTITWPLALGILAATCVMCVVSGILAVSKLLSADPAELFA